MIKEVSGDILMSTAGAIVHGIAPHDHFNQGLALALKERWPSMYKDFRHYCHSHSPSVGSLWTWSGPDIRIVCLFTQEAPKDDRAHPGKASLESLHHCFRELKKEISKQGLKSIALTRIGTGVGGLDWPNVKLLISKDLADLAVPVFLYSEFKPGVKASEVA